MVVLLAAFEASLDSSQEAFPKFTVLLLVHRNLHLLINNLHKQTPEIVLAAIVDISYIIQIKK